MSGFLSIWQISIGKGLEAGLLELYDAFDTAKSMYLKSL